jgi:hypothetical protein
LPLARPECAFPDRSAFVGLFYCNTRRAGPIAGVRGMSMTVKMMNGEVGGVTVDIYRPTSPKPFSGLDYVLCAIAFFLVGIAFVPQITTWVK